MANIRRNLIDLWSTHQAWLARPRHSFAAAVPTVQRRRCTTLCCTRPGGLRGSTQYRRMIHDVASFGGITVLYTWVRIIGQCFIHYCLNAQSVYNRGLPTGTSNAVQELICQVASLAKCCVFFACCSCYCLVSHDCHH